MNSAHSLQALLNNTATEEDIELLKHLLASGEISIGGNVNQSVIIIGSGNTVELPPAALDRLNARLMLGNLDRDLTGEEIAAGLRRLDKLLPNRAPVLLPHYKEQVGRLRPILKTEIKSLSESSRRERLEALAAINSICVEALDISFNGLALGEEAPKYDARSPFRGLESFRPEDSEFFFGREALTQKLVGKIKAHSFLAVLGASGSGKSSLVMAGVIPALDSDYVVFRPGTKPLDELESARGKSLIVVDQFEELFTLTRDESTRKDFIARLLDESARLQIILTLRSDFLGEVGAYRTLSAEIQNHLEIIPPMDMDELRRAMEGQAGVVGLRFEADLSQQILDDVAGEPGAMPLLQHALWELWNRRHGRNLRASEYRAFGGVKQAITSTAEKVYADCSKPEQDQLRDIFLRLTRLDDSDEGRDTRRRVPLGDLIPSGRDAASITLLLDKLAGARLIVKTVNDDKTEVEVAHEALIRHWDRLRLWLNEDRDVLRLRESVSESAKEWDRSGMHESLLNSRWVKLDEALLLVQDSRYRLTDVEQAYLMGCEALRNREQRERERRLRYTMFATIAVAVIFLILGGFGLVKSNESNVNAQKAESNAATAQAETDARLIAEKVAQEEAARNKSNELAAIALSKLDKDPILSVLLTRQAVKLTYPEYGYITPNVSSAIYQSLATSHIPTAKMNLGKWKDAVVSSDRNKVLLIGTDNFLKIIDFNGQELLSNQSVRTNIISAAMDPKGNFVVAITEDAKIIIWDIVSNETYSRNLGNSTANSPTTILFSKSGNLVSISQFLSEVDGCEVDIFDLDGNMILRLDKLSIDWNEKKEFHCAEFDPTGSRILTLGYEQQGGSNELYVWDRTGKNITTISQNGLLDADFSNDGNTIVGSDDTHIYIWNINGELLDKFTGYDFSQLGRNSLLSGDAFFITQEGNQLNIRDENSKVITFAPITMSDDTRVGNIELTSDSTIAIIDWRNWFDQLLKIQVVDTNGQELFVIDDIQNSQPGKFYVGFGPNNDIVITKNTTGQIRMFDLDGQEVVDFSTLDPIESIEFSADEKSFYTIDSSKNIVIWTWQEKSIKTLKVDSGYPNMIVTGAISNLIGVAGKSPTRDYALIWYPYANTRRFFQLNDKISLYPITSIDIDMSESYILVGNGYTSNTGNRIKNADLYSTAGNSLSSFVMDKKRLLLPCAGGPCIATETVISRFISNRNQIILVRDVGEINIFDYNGNLLKEYVTEQPISNITYLRDVNLLIYSYGSILNFWDFDKSEKWERMTSSEIKKIILSSGGSELIVFHDDYTEFLDVYGDVLFRIDEENVKFADIDTARENITVVSKEGDVVLWNKVTNNAIQISHAFPVNQAMFTLDKKLITNTANGQIWIYSITGDLISRLDGHEDEIVDMAFNYDKGKLITISKDSTIKVWPYIQFNLDDLLKELDLRALRGLTSEECQTYLGVNECP
jgi:WD40 repeat protein/energy-coupling factor transporter ATP-binding protein EcfA2